MRQAILVIVGMKGSGKTETARSFLDLLPRSVTIDTQEEYGGVAIHDATSLSKYLNQRGTNGRFRVAFRPSGFDSVSVPKVFSMLHHLRDSWLAVEEASKWMGSVLGRAEKSLVWFVQYGRHNRISQLYLARRFSELDRNVTANADVIVSFVQKEPRDLEYIRGAAGKDAAERISQLGEHEWDYVRSDHEGVVALLNSISEGSTDGLETSTSDTGKRSPDRERDLDGGTADRTMEGVESDGAEPASREGAEQTNPGDALLPAAGERGKPKPKNGRRRKTRPRDASLTITEGDS